MNEQFLGLGESNQQVEKTPIVSGTREKHVSRISVWRYLRPLVRNNNCSVRSRNRIGAFACDDSLPQCLAAVATAAADRLNIPLYTNPQIE